MVTAQPLSQQAFLGSHLERLSPSPILLLLETQLIREVSLVSYAEELSSAELILDECEL
jgi:hypothetical protein